MYYPYMMTEDEFHEWIRGAEEITKREKEKRAMPNPEHDILLAYKERQEEEIMPLVRELVEALGTGAGYEGDCVVCDLEVDPNLGDSENHEYYCSLARLKIKLGILSDSQITFAEAPVPTCNECGGVLPQVNPATGQA